MAIPDPTQLQAVRRYTASAVPDTRKSPYGAPESDFFSLDVVRRAALLPREGTRARTKALYDLYWNPYNWLGQSVITSVVHGLAAKKWTIKGKRKVEAFQNVCLYADMGAGWVSFLEKVIAPYCYQDIGGWVEIVAPGNPNRPPTGAVVGVKSLDPLRVTPTGDPDFPILYTNTAGELHRMHRTRVYQFVDMHSPNESRPGYGLSALSRAAAITHQQVWMAAYVNASLDDKPKPGINVFSNINKPQWDMLVASWRDQQLRDEKPPLGDSINLFSTDPQFPAKVESVKFSEPPQNFNYKDYTEIQANAWALAIGTDPNNIWRRTSGGLGSGNESEVAHSQQGSRTDGLIAAEFERFMNTAVLPDYLTFAFEERDPYESEQRGKTAQLWSGFGRSVENYTSQDEIRRLIAAQVPEYFEIVTDEKGEMITLADDPKGSDEQTAVDAGNAPVSASTSNQRRQAEATVNSQNAGAGEKAIADTRQRFEAAFTDLMTQGREKRVSKRAFEAQLRALIARYGDLALRDGLLEGGVEQPDEDDAAAYARTLVEQSKYVKAFTANLYAAPDAPRPGRAEMWANKSLMPFYQIGVLSIARNGNYKWIYGDTEHCADCLRLNGQVHRMRDYVRKGWLPKADKLACKGFRCGCQLERTTERATGKF